MATDYFHRLVVTGRAERIWDFSKRIHREYPRTVAGETWTEIVPFSFAALYDIAPRARTIEAEVPYDAYELSAWPVTRNGRRDALVRYQFQTRNMEMAPLIRVLARAVRDLTFTLVTFCLDDSSIESYRFEAGRQRKWTLPPRVSAAHWERARRKFGLSGDDVYRGRQRGTMGGGGNAQRRLESLGARCSKQFACPPLRLVEQTSAAHARRGTRNRGHSVGRRGPR